MKKIVFIIILGLLWTTIPVEAQRRPGHREQYEYSQGRPRLQYVIGHNAVLFDGKVIKGASPARFKVLRDGYARDDWKVYYMGKAIKGANSNSFKVLDNGYAKDSWDVYYHGSKIKGASSGASKCFTAVMHLMLGMYISRE